MALIEYAKALIQASFDNDMKVQESQELRQNSLEVTLEIYLP